MSSLRLSTLKRLAAAATIAALLGAGAAPAAHAGKPVKDTTTTEPATEAPTTDPDAPTTGTGRKIK